MKQSIHKTPTSTSYKNYEREIYMSEYVTLPRDQIRMMKTREIIAWVWPCSWPLLLLLDRGTTWPLLITTKKH
jgi:hypothetical protein